MSALAACDLDTLRKVTLFSGLTTDQLYELDDMMHLRSYHAGATLMFVEEKGEIIYFIISGTVKIHVQQPDGTDVIISILGAGDIVGDMSLLDNTLRCANVVTLEDVTVAWMDRATFQGFLRTMPALTYNLACILTGRLRLANEQIQALAAREAESRLSRQILAFADRYGQVAADGGVLIPIRLTQADLAGMVGASREYVNKIMVSYKERRYISVDHSHRITIHNHQALTRRCG